MSDITKEQNLNLEFFNSKLNEWLEDVAYKNKFIVIEKQEVKAVFDSGSDAYKHAMQNLTQGDFIIKEIIKKEDAGAYLPTVF